MSADGSYNPRLTRRQLLASLGWAGASVALAGRRPRGRAAREGQTWSASRHRRRRQDRTLGHLTTSSC